jgi:hypothetical protein
MFLPLPPVHAGDELLELLPVKPPLERGEVDEWES